MDEEIWDHYDHQTGQESHLRRTDPGQYELAVFNNFRHGSAATLDLDRKHLKDLFNAIGNEIGAF